MAGLKVVPVKSLPDGSLDIADLRTKAEQHKDNLAAFMVRIAFTDRSFPSLNLPPRSRTHLLSACLRMASRKRVISSIEMAVRSISTERT
jgi:hypothetical protein